MRASVEHEARRRRPCSTKTSSQRPLLHVGTLQREPTSEIHRHEMQLAPNLLLVALGPTQQR